MKDSQSPDKPVEPAQPDHRPKSGAYSPYSSPAYSNTANFGSDQQSSAVDVNRPAATTGKRAGNFALIVAIATLVIWVVVGWVTTLLIFFVSGALAISIANIAMTVVLLALAVVGLILGALGLKREQGRAKSAVAFGISLAILVAIVGGWLGNIVMGAVVSSL